MATKQYGKVWQSMAKTQKSIEKYGKKSRLLFSEIDSLMCQIETKDIYQDFSTQKSMFDLSNYSGKSKFYDGLNKLAFGEMKDETAGVPSKGIF